MSGKRILLIVDHCGPGEALRVSPLLGAVRADHPSARITLLVSENAYPLFAGDGRFDRVVASDLYRRTSRRARRLRTLAGAARLAARLGFGYDLVIVFLWGTTALNALARVVGRRRAIAYRHHLGALLANGPAEYGTDGDIAAGLALLAEAGIRFRPHDTPALTVADRDRTYARDLMDTHGRRPGRPLVVMHPGSDWACQQWLHERWAQLADGIARQHDADLAFTGVAAEHEFIEKIRARIGSPSMSLAGQTTLPQLAAVIAQADLCVSVDSAAHDIAQALRVPAVVLAGPTAPDAPAGRALRVVNATPVPHRATILSCQARFPAGFCFDYSCPFAGLRRISVERVEQAIEASGWAQERQAGGFVLTGRAVAD